MKSKKLQTLTEKLFNHLIVTNRFRMRITETSLYSAAMSRLLTIIYLREPCPLKIVCQLHGVTTSTGSIMVDKLVKEGLVSRIQDEKDRRCIVLTLTPQGTQIAADNLKVQYRYIETFLARLDEADQDILNDSLEKAGAIFAKMDTENFPYER